MKYEYSTMKSMDQKPLRPVQKGGGGEKHHCEFYTVSKSNNHWAINPRVLKCVDMVLTVKKKKNSPAELNKITEQLRKTETFKNKMESKKKMKQKIYKNDKKIKMEMGNR